MIEFLQTFRDKHPKLVLVITALLCALMAFSAVCSVASCFADDEEVDYKEYVDDVTGYTVRDYGNDEVYYVIDGVEYPVSVSSDEENYIPPKWHHVIAYGTGTLSGVTVEVRVEGYVLAYSDSEPFDDFQDMLSYMSDYSIPSLVMPVVRIQWTDSDEVENAYNCWRASSEHMVAQVYASSDQGVSWSSSSRQIWYDWFEGDSGSFDDEIVELDNELVNPYVEEQEAYTPNKLYDVLKTIVGEPNNEIERKWLYVGSIGIFLVVVFTLAMIIKSLISK